MCLIKQDIPWEMLGDIDREGFLEVIMDVYEFQCRTNPSFIPSLNQLTQDGLIRQEWMKDSSYLEYGDFHYYDRYVNGHNYQAFWDAITPYAGPFDRDCARLLNQYYVCHEKNGRLIYMPCGEVW